MASIIGCAAPGPTLRASYDSTADFASYRTYRFADELGTDRAGYATFITGHFRRAVGLEMEARGYRFDETDSDLIVNFFADVRHATDVIGTSVPAPGFGYYDYRQGLYTAWPFYDVTTVHYRVRTANVDVVDARLERLVWEGVAEGRLTEEVIANPGPGYQRRGRRFVRALSGACACR